MTHPYRYYILIRFFFFHNPATTEIYTLSLHDALPICLAASEPTDESGSRPPVGGCRGEARSEEHTSELQSRGHLVCRLLLEKKKWRKTQRTLSWSSSSSRRSSSSRSSRTT